MVKTALFAFFIPPPVLVPYLTGLLVLAFGLVTILRDREVPQAQGIDKVLPVGRVLLAVSYGIFSGEHLTSAKALSGVVPTWIPWHLFWAYFVGAALLAAAISIATKKRMGLAATLLGIMLFCFVILIHIPVLKAAPSRISATVLLRDLAFSAGAFALTGARSAATFARYVVAFVLLFFGIQHFLHPGFVPVVPLQLALPSWAPFPWFWAYGVGAALFITGMFILLNWHARLAATWLGLIVVFVICAIYLPILLQEPSDIGVAMNYFADTLTFGGTMFALAISMPKSSP